MSCMKKVDDEYRHARAEKGLTEELDYSFDYTKTLALVDPVDTISTSSWAIIGTGAVLGSETVDGDITTAWISGGDKVGNTLRLTNTVVTAGGRTHVRLLIIKIINRLALIPEDD